jgi:hypothetical protein
MKSVSREQINEVVSLIEELQQLTGKKVIFEKDVLKHTREKTLRGMSPDRLLASLQYWRQEREKCDDEHRLKVIKKIIHEIKAELATRQPVMQETKNNK